MEVVSSFVVASVTNMEEFNVRSNNQVSSGLVIGKQTQPVSKTKWIVTSMTPSTDQDQNAFIRGSIW